MIYGNALLMHAYSNAGFQLGGRGHLPLLETGHPPPLRIAINHVHVESFNRNGCQNWLFCSFVAYKFSLISFVLKFNILREVQALFSNPVIHIHVYNGISMIAGEVVNPTPGFYKFLFCRGGSVVIVSSLAAYSPFSVSTY